LLALVHGRATPSRWLVVFCHSVGKNACWIISLYVRHRPGRLAAVGRPSAAQREPPWLENGPSTLSDTDTSCPASGVTLGLVAVPVPCSSFLPIFGQLRPWNDISKSDNAGPTICEAMLEKRINCRVRTSVPPLLTYTWPCGSDAPKMLPPLKSWRPRPSQKLSK